MSSKAITARLDRLTGDSGSGGGMMLPPLFKTVLDQLQDHGSRTISELRAPVIQATHHKYERAEMVYGSDDPYGKFIRDGLEQLQDRGFVAPDGVGAWRLGSKFVAGRELTVIPRRGHHKAVTVTVYSAAERKARGRAERERMEVTSLLADLREDGPGLRKLDRQRVNVIRASIETLGWLDLPILVAEDPQTGEKWILDGRHRKAAAKEAGIEPTTRTVKIDSAREALAVALAANDTQSWSLTDRKRLADRLQAEGIGVEEIGKVIGRTARRALIEAALRGNPARSDRAIARQTRCDDHTVARVRSDLEATAEIPQLRKRTGQDGRERRVSGDLRNDRSSSPRPPAPSEAAHRARMSPIQELAIEAVAAARDTSFLGAERRTQEVRQIRIAIKDAIKKDPSLSAGEQAAIAQHTAEALVTGQSSSPPNGLPSWMVIAEQIRDLPPADRTLLFSQIKQLML